MYPNELGSCAVGCLALLRFGSSCLLTHSRRYAPFQYTPDGQEVMERLWKETWDEFSFVEVNGILESLKSDQKL